MEDNVAVLFLFLLLILSPSILLGAFALVKRRKLSSKIAWTGLAVLLSLPVGAFICLLPGTLEFYLYNVEPSPGQGIALLPMFLGWIASVLAWLIGSLRSWGDKGRTDR